MTRSLAHPIAFAHRGARAHAPENTLEAFVLALRMGAEALESDVWVSADGVPVLDHDGVVPTRRGKVPIRSVPRSQLPSHMPTVAELYAACGSSFELSLDLKDPEAFGPLLKVTSAQGVQAVERLWICDRSIDRCMRMAHEEPAINVVASLRAVDVRGRTSDVVQRLAGNEIRSLNLRGPNWTRTLVDRCHDAGMLAFSWGLQSRHALRRALQLGVDAVYSDHVDVMCSVLSEAA